VKNTKKHNNIIIVVEKRDETVADDAATELLLSESLKVGRRALDARSLSSRRLPLSSRRSSDSGTRTTGRGWTS